LRCYRHVMRTNDSDVVSVVLKINVEGKIGRWRPDKIRIDVIESDMKEWFVLVHEE